MTSRVLRTHVSVLGGDGMPVVLRAGTAVPEEYVDQITNPRCYVDASALDAPAQPVQPPRAPKPDPEKPAGPPQGEGEGDAGEAEQDEAEQDEAGEPGEGDEDERTPFDLDHTDEDEDAGEQPADEAPAEPDVQKPDAGAAYEAQTVTALRELLEKRGLPATGPKRALVARLVAADAAE